MIEGDAHFFVEQLTEMGGVIACVLCNVLQSDFFLEMEIDIFKGFLNLTFLRGIVHRLLVVEVEK